VAAEKSQEITEQNTPGVSEVGILTSVPATFYRNGGMNSNRLTIYSGFAKLITDTLFLLYFLHLLQNKYFTIARIAGF
jgi:hypothetical protein